MGKGKNVYDSRANREYKIYRAASNKRFFIMLLIFYIHIIKTKICYKYYNKST